MKKLLKLFLCSLITLSLVACGGGGGGGDDGGANEKVVTIMAKDLISMDTAVATDGGSFSAQMMCISGLYELDADGVPVYDLAEKVVKADDGLSYDITIRSDAVWENGDPVTVDDFIYGWSRVADPEFASEYAFIIDTANIKYAECYLGTDNEENPNGYTIDDFKNGAFEKISDKEFIVYLDAPCSFFENLLAFPSFFPVNKAYCENAGDQYALSTDTILACGPWTLDSWTIGYSYEFVLNKSYFNYDKYVAGGAPDRIVFRVLDDSQTAALEYESGNIDLIELNSTQVDAYASSDAFVQRLEGYSFYLLININNTEVNNNTNYQNINVRKAMAYAVDRDTLAKALNDGSIADAGLLPRTFAINALTGKDYRDEAPVYTSYNLDLAKEYYAKAVAEIGSDIVIDLMYGTNEGDQVIKAAEQVQYYLEETGFTVNLNPHIKADRLQSQRDHNFEVSLTRWGPDYTDPKTYMDLFVGWNSSNNQGAWYNDEYDALILDADAQTDYAARWQDYIDAEKILVEDDNAVVPVYQSGKSYLINPNIAGVEFHAGGVDSYRHIIVK